MGKVQQKPLVPRFANLAVLQPGHTAAVCRQISGCHVRYGGLVLLAPSPGGRREPTWGSQSGAQRVHASPGRAAGS